MDVDDIAELKDELADQMAEIEERQEFFADAAREGEDELLEQLDELEALAMEDEMNVEVSNAPIAGQAQAQPAAQQPIAQHEDEEEKELNALAGMMA